MSFTEEQLQQLQIDLGYLSEDDPDDNTEPWFHHHLWPPIADTEHQNYETSEEEEKYTEMDDEEHDNQRSSANAGDENQTNYKCDNPFGIRQMASVLLSDTSESDNDLDESCELGSHINRNEITEEMYKAIKNQIIEQKSKNSADPFIKDWIQQQEKMYFKWKDKQELKKTTTTQDTDKAEDDEADDTDCIPKVTILESKPKYGKKQIKEEMDKMDPAKRERWENWYIQWELSKSKKQPIMRSDARKDYIRLTEGKGHENLVLHYKTELANLKDNIKTSVEKMERIMGQLEAKEPEPHGDLKPFDGPEEIETDQGQESDSSEATGASDEHEPLTEQEMNELEDIMYSKILIPPNEEKIQELLNMKIVYPEKPPETVKLGRSIDEVEESLLESKGLNSYIMRVVYFFRYESAKDADFVRTEYDLIVKDIVPQEPTNKGCLLIYENVHIAIVMVEGAEFEILKHFSKIQRAELYGSIKSGRVLYIHQFLVKTYFNKWVVRVESPPPGKIRYLTKSKRVVYRTAASRVARVSEMLHKVYRHVSKEEKYLIDPRSIYTKSKYIILLPSPSLFAYLMKYSVLRDLKPYLESLGEPLDIDDDDEQLFAFTEDLVYSNYIDSDEDEVKKAKLDYARAVVQGGEDHRKRIKDMDDLRVKDTGEKITWDEFHLDEIGATVVDGRIKMTDDPNHPAVRLGAAIEARQTKAVNGKEKPAKFVEAEPAKGQFLTFIQKGSESWNQRIKQYRLNIRQSVPIPRDTKSRLSASKDEIPEISVTQVEEEIREMQSESDSSEVDCDSLDNTSDSSTSLEDSE